MPTPKTKTKVVKATSSGPTGPTSAPGPLPSPNESAPVTPIAPVTPSVAPAAELEVVEPAKIVNDQLVLSRKHLSLIKEMMAKDATQPELELFIMMARRTRLDPLMKQLYFIKYGGKVSYVTSIDGYRIIAHRTGEFAGIDEPKYTKDASGNAHCSVTVYKMVQGVRCGFSATVKFSEYDTNANNWV